MLSIPLLLIYSKQNWPISGPTHLPSLYDYVMYEWSLTKDLSNIHLYVQVISIPFAWTHEAVSPITWNSQGGFQLLHLIIKELKSHMTC